MGIPLKNPFGKKYRLGEMYVGGYKEVFLDIVLIILCALMLYQHQPS
jgi:hypothetical protein